MSQKEQDSRIQPRVRVIETPDAVRRPSTATPRVIPKSILKPSSSQGSIKPHHGTSRKATNRAPQAPNHATPPRVQPGQPSSSNSTEPLRARKTGGKSTASSSTANTNTNKKPTNTKTYKSLTPLDQQLDNEYEEQLLSQKRDRLGNMAGFARRRTQIRRDGNIGEDRLRLSADDPQHVAAQLSPIMNLRIGGQAIDLDEEHEDEPRYRPQPRVANVKNPNFGQRALKAARKYQSVEASSPGSDSSGSESDSSRRSSSSSGRTLPRADEDEDESDPKPNSDSEDVTMTDVSEHPPELEFDEKKMITAPLPDINDVKQAENIRPAPQRSPQHEPSANLVSAIKALCPLNIRMPKRKIIPMPFLIRRLRRGFLERCRRLLVPIYPLDKEIQFQVQYTIAGEDPYQVEVNNWMCPICDFFGEFATREMLECHLKWDHQEVYCEWKDLGLDKIQSWRLELLIQESEPDFVSPSPTPRLLSPVHEKAPQRTRTPLTAEHPRIKRPLTPEPENDSGLFPSVSLSPSTPRSAHRQSMIPDAQIKREEIEATLELPQWSAIPSPNRRPPSTTTASASQSTGSTPRHLPLPGRANQTTVTATASTSAQPTTTLPTTSQQSLRPPPSDNLLGPAAQPPYLPSDIGGVEVLYSCRPGDPSGCLFDLLGTLPMEPFGLLAWEVIEREDEIYESDDVKEEYKVMQALWARWIMLNRNKFIANYAKGVIAFVDEYWKMIHYAAGWDALRYFLFIFLANSFLTGHEVAQTLTHYEGLTGMDYD